MLVSIWRYLNIPATTPESPPLAAEEPVTAATPVEERPLPVATVAVFGRPDWLAFTITFGVTLAVYLWTMAPEVTLENSGMMVTAAAYGGVPHIPGYPVWTLWAWAFTKLLPFSNIAWRVGVASGVAAALASGLVAMLVSRGGKLMLEKNARFAGREAKEQNQLRFGAGCAAGIGLALSLPVWQQAVVAETWTFGLLLFAVILCLFFRWLNEPTKRRYLYWAIYSYGALLTGNQELALAAPALLVIVIIGEPKLGRDFFVLIAAIVSLACLLGEFSPLNIFRTYTDRNVLLLAAFIAVGVAALAIIVVTRRLGTHWWPAILCSVVLFLGLAWWFYLPVASMTNPPMNWGYPRTADGFLHTISRGQMQAAFPVRGLARFAEQCGGLFRRTGDGLGWYYLLFAILPFCVLHRMPPVMRKWLL